jgi:hypothetical protein
MTDDQTEILNNVWGKSRNDVTGLVSALDQGDIVLSLLLAESGYGYGGRRGGQYPGGAGGGGGGPWGGIPGGIGFPRGGYPRRGPTIGGHGTKPADTGQVAEQSGGDRMNVDQASALEDTLTRLRQRYALHFNLPEGARVGQERNVVVDLASAARRRYPDAELRYRRSYLSQDSNTSTPAEVTGTTQERSQQPATAADSQQQSTRQRTRRVSDPGSGAMTGPMIDRDQPEAQPQQSSPPTPTPVRGWPKNDPAVPATTQTKTAPPVTEPAKVPPTKGGWPRVK